jgi:hypothetical protein
MSAMSGERKCFAVKQDGVIWHIECGPKRLGAFRSQMQAIHQAVVLAFEAGRAGDEAFVLQKDGDGTWRLCWSFGRDPYPPLDFKAT